MVRRRTVHGVRIISGSGKKLDGRRGRGGGLGRQANPSRLRRRLLLGREIAMFRRTWQLPRHSHTGLITFTFRYLSTAPLLPEAILVIESPLASVYIEFASAGLPVSRRTRIPSDCWTRRWSTDTALSRIRGHWRRATSWTVKSWRTGRSRSSGPSVRWTRGKRSASTPTIWKRTGSSISGGRRSGIVPSRTTISTNPPRYSTTATSPIRYFYRRAC